jgi:catechol 2,3-dioxygenase-like lactoylglutathione lyase family enzyme/GNAT superfamily N-acetyltransferase
MKFNHVTPILYSSSITASLDYYTQVLGFENRWDWGSPPTFGGVSKDGVEIFFCENGQGNPGTWLSVFVNDVDQLHETLKARGATIVSPPISMEWGVREMLVADPDGHKIRFGHGVHVFDKDKALATLPDAIKIIERMPTVHEYRRLTMAVKWSPPADDAVIEKIIAASIFSVVAEDSNNGTAIGCTLLLGDNTSFYYIKDVMVHPDWRHKRVGSALMQAVTNWLNNFGAEKALVGLYTGESLAPFYSQFDFRPAFGMSRRIKHEND